MAGNPSLRPRARAAIASADRVFVSAATAIELSTKVRIGKLPEARLLTAELPTVLIDQGFIALPITLAHGQLSGSLPGPHRDPFDRLLAAQSIIEKVPVVTNDRAIIALGAAHVW
jgi:PIN domain nuclease of toxin-antitoxin system